MADGVPPSPPSDTLLESGGDLPPDLPVAASPSSGKGRRYRWISEFGVIVVVAIVLAVVLRLFVVETFSVPSGSMIPTLQIGDRIIVDKLAYNFHSIHRGDVVVFRRPADEDCGPPPVADLVKRVIGLPGDRIKSVGNTVYIDGKPLAEPYLPKGTQLGLPITPQTVPTGNYFMMGDNRSESCDSRSWGYVKRSLIVGKVDAIIWPISQLHWF